MHTVNRMIRNIGLLSLCVALIVPMAGCNKMLAQYSQNQAQKRKDEAVKNEAEKFAPELLNQTNTEINKATTQITQQQYADARATAKGAAETAKRLLTETIQRRAQSLRDEAFIWIQRGRTNQAEQIDQAKFQAVQTLNEEGRDQFNKQKFEASIQTFLRVVGDTQSLLANLRQEAESGYKEAQGMKQELVTEGAPENAPEYIEKIDHQIKEIDRFIKQEYDYRSALNVRREARQTLTAGRTEAQRVRSDKMINEIEGLLNTAYNLKSEEFASQSNTNVTREWENLSLLYTQAKYSTVLLDAPKVKQHAEALIQETKVSAAKTQLSNARQAITRLTDNKARHYLPGRVEQLDDLTSKSQGEIDQTMWVEARATAERALELVRNIEQEFDALAQSEINKASEQLGASEATFKTMEQIFDKKIPGNWTGSDAALENAKATMKEELRSRLSTAGLNLSLATLRRQEKDFDMAIEVARQVADSAEYITGQTFRVVAHNSVLEIAGELSKYEREGGRQYATAELDKTHKMLDDTKGLLEKEQYRQAVRRAADTKAQLAILYQELARVAVNRIDRAQSQLKAARENKADKYESQSLAQAVTMLDQARGSLEQGDNMQKAIEAAATAESIAEDATQQSLREWGQDMSRESEIIINRATAAGAARFAPEKLQQAQALRQNLNDMLAANHYQQAVEIGSKAVDAANEALMAQVNDAEDAIASARRFNGFQYEPDRLAHAIVALKNAREHIATGKYQQAEIESQMALTTAQEVTVKAKRLAFSDQLDSLKARMDDAGKKGPGYYQIKDLSRIAGEMNRVKNQFDPNSYQNYADKVKLLDAQLAGLMESSPDALKDTVATLQTRLKALDDRGARRDEEKLVRDVEKKIQYAETDFKSEKYRSSFSNAQDAANLLDTIELKLDERQFDTELTQFLKDLNTQMDRFSYVLNMGSRTMLKMAIGPQGRPQAVSLLNSAPPASVRNEITQIGARVERMKVPPTRVALQEAALKMFATAKEGSVNFEKLLILDQFSVNDATRIIETAYMQMLNARDAQKRLQAQVEHPQLEMKPVGVERVISYQGS